MNTNSKLKKLQLPKTSRTTSNTQISKFFSTPSTSTTEVTKTLNNFSVTNEAETKHSQNSLLSKNSIEFDSDDDSEGKSLRNRGKSSTFQNNSEKHQSRSTTVSKFFNDSIQNEKDFQTLPVTHKSLPKSKPKQQKRTYTTKRKKISGNIKSAFARSEEIFSNIVAQHSIADKFNPDEIQMALALSMSEAKCQENYKDDDSKDSCDSINSNKIREKLQKYGFQTNANKDDYDLSFFLNGKKRTKWRNKYTPLTLRNEEKQYNKLMKNFNEILDEQYKPICPINCNYEVQERFKLSSKLLRNIKSANMSLKLDEQTDSIELFYVTELFTTSTAKAGCLMKDLRTIPGRDLSPIRQSEKDQVTNNGPISEIGETRLIEDYENISNKDLHSPCSKKAKLKSNVNDSPEIENECQQLLPDNRQLSPDLFVEIDSDSSGAEFETISTCNSKHVALDEEVKTLHESNNNVTTSEHSFEKSISSSVDFIDLTQRDENEKDFSTKSSFNLTESRSQNKSFNDASDNSDCCIILSDDEVNYSIRKSNHKKVIYFDEVEEKKLDFSFVDLIEDEEIPGLNSSIDLTSSQYNEKVLKILEGDSDEILSSLTPVNSQSKLNKHITPPKSQLKSPNSNEFTIPQSKVASRHNSENFKSVKKFNSSSKCNRKFLSESFISPLKTPNEVIMNFKKSASFKFENQSSDDIDEIDRLIYGSTYKTAFFNKPKDLDKLFYSKLKNDCETVNTDSVHSALETEDVKEIVSNGKVYLVRTRNLPCKPDFERMDSPTRMKELYKYGLKPLKKKQAVIMLEYIYNQTHPFVMDGQKDSVDIIDKDDILIEDNTENSAVMKLHDLKDCNGTKLLKNDGLLLEEIEDEIYIFQTNLSKRIFTALVPFHVAWYNLLKSNTNLRETILYYEPVDLQEIYIFFKRIGYRYDPKDIKKFFDKRSIIFRYDLNSDGNNRHVA